MRALSERSGSGRWRLSGSLELDDVGFGGIPWDEETDGGYGDSSIPSMGLDVI